VSPWTGSTPLAHHKSIQMEAQWSHDQSALSAWYSPLPGVPVKRPHNATGLPWRIFSYFPGYKIPWDLRFSWWWKLTVHYTFTL
jgi:hypothetical protein